MSCRTSGKTWQRAGIIPYSFVESPFEYRFLLGKDHHEEGWLKIMIRLLHVRLMKKVWVSLGRFDRLFPNDFRRVSTKIEFVY